MKAGWSPSGWRENRGTVTLGRGRSVGVRSDRTPQPDILLEILHPPRPIGLQGAIFLALAIAGLLADSDPPTCLGGRHTLREYDRRFTQLAGNLLGLVLLEQHFQPPSCSKITSISDHSEGADQFGFALANDFSDHGKVVRPFAHVAGYLVVP